MKEIKLDGQDNIRKMPHVQKESEYKQIQHQRLALQKSKIDKGQFPAL